MELETYAEGNKVVTRATVLSPHTIGSIDQISDQLTVRDTDGLQAADPILVKDAGPEGGHLVTTVASITGNTVTLAADAAARVSRVTVGKLVDPATVTFTARNGDGTPTAYTQADPEVTNPSTGVWELRLDADEGDWQIHMDGTTPAVGADTGYRVPHSRAKA